MANVTEKGKERSGLTQLSPVRKTGWGIFFSLLSLFVFVALWDYDPSNYHTFPPDGGSPLLGQTGIITGRYAFAFFGLTAWLLPWFFGVCSWLFLIPSSKRLKLQKLLPLPIILLSVCLMANLRDFYAISINQKPMLDQFTFEHGAGGSLGAWLYSGMPILGNLQNSGGILRIWIGEVGTWVLAILLLFSSLAVHFSFGADKCRKTVSLCSRLFSFSQRNETREKISKEPKEIDEPSEASPSHKPFWKWILPFKKIKQPDPLFGDVSQQDSLSKEFSKVGIKPNKISTQHSIKDDGASEKDSDQEIPQEEKEPNKQLEEIIEKNLEEVSLDDGFKVVRAEKTEKATNLFPERKGDYHFPTLELLMEAPEVSAGGDEDHMIKAKRLKETLSEFKIDVELGEVHTGPVITRYDIHPAAGVRVEKIANLDKNLAMALRAESVRILAPVPGKGCVGVEVPNELAAPVCLKEILQSKAWADANAEIPIVLGKEASGRPLVADLTKMPHLLVAGSTGSGKTVCINAIIASLCYHSSPEDVRFIMVDPKIVEMKVYNDLPHMLIPVVTEPKKVPGALKWLLVEMERRYQIFSKVGVRNIAGFNAKILKDKEEKEKAQLLDAEMTAEERAALSSVQVPRDDDALEIPENKLPYIVCIIDELADLMMVAQADVETGIARLAQLARAAGIHLIIATQRPSVNVITGVIKANLPSRISFRVASYRDSQTILDGKGAESLIGKGDMLFIPPGSATFMRAQGAFVSDDEINGIVDYLKRNGPPQIIEEVREQIESAGEEDILGPGGDSEDEDPMLKKAIEIIRTTKRASTSNLQRKLSIGYNRAARIMDELEERGVVGPDLPGQGREILLDL
ncbi:MAG: DNA translocase FtsK 4TM domain-containing protein [Opitutae bacterium]